MKISELTNAPQWLKDAIVENEDVEIVNNYVIWKCGAWEGGTHSMMSKYIPLIDNNIITIGCKRKTVEEWNEWFSGTEEFETKRGTKEFQMIYAHFKACEAYINAMK